MGNQIYDPDDDSNWLTPEENANNLFMNANYEGAASMYKQLASQNEYEQYYYVAYYLCMSKGFMIPLIIDDKFPKFADEYKQFLVRLSETYHNKNIPDFNLTAAEFISTMPNYIVSLLLNIKNKLRESIEPNVSD